MPTYDFICADCQNLFDLKITYQDYGKKPVHCPNCRGTKVKRRINRVRVTRSVETDFGDMADPAALDRLEDDPKSMGKMLRGMKSKMGAEDVGPEFDEVVGRLESGQNPEQIEKDMPDLGGGMPAGGDEF